MESCNLPRDLLIDILARLPVKSLMRFKSVCKFFYYLIKNDRHLMDKHYEISRTKPDCVVLDSGSSAFSEFHLLYKESESDEIGCIRLDMKKSGLKRVMCCHGLFCLIFGSDSDLSYHILIWNPSTREFKDLPSITVPYTPPKEGVLYDGFGFGFSKMGWKVVMLWYFKFPFQLPIEYHNIGMVCSQDGDSWGWRQIDELPNIAVCCSEDFYLKGKYYWRVQRESLLCWFDMADESFGMIKLPPISVTVTVMNETIALVNVNDNHIVIWLMNENENDITWHKQTSVECGLSIQNNIYWTSVGEPWNEYWDPLGIWNVGTPHLIVLPGCSGYWNEDEEMNYIPYLLSVDLATQERKTIYPTQERKSIKIVQNSTGYVQVYNEKNISIPHEWRVNRQLFNRHTRRMRVYNNSLYFL